MVPAEPADLLDIEVVYSPAPRAVDRVALKMAPGSTLAQALRVSGLLERHGLLLDEQLPVGIWMKAKPLDTVLRQHDRVEVWRGLRVDPKEARRLRYRKQKTDRPAPGGRKA